MTSLSAQLEGSTVAIAQAMWAERPARKRLEVLARFRHRLARETEALVEAIPAALHRCHSDTLVAEVLPLLAACEFLEKNAAQVLRTRRLGRFGRPPWLWGLQSEVRRVPFGRILVIGPSNYPLLLPGVQALQGLAAGNAVVWKPGTGGQSVANVFAEALALAGLPTDLLHVTDDTVEAGRAALENGADKIFFTGSATAGREILRIAAQTITPCVVELSGCDAVIVLPSADLRRVVAALAFGMRLNGSATCMAPRRVLLFNADAERKSAFLSQLLASFRWIKGVELTESVRARLFTLLCDAASTGAQIHGEIDRSQQPLVLTDVTPAMQVAKADVFAPLLSVIDINGQEELLIAMNACPFGLTAAIFGDHREALKLGEKLTVGTLLVNDLIVPTADPRVPFGGRLDSGFGVTRGAEGLLEMTAVKVVSVRHGRGTRHYEEPRPGHETLFNGAIKFGHAKSWSERFAGVKQILSGASKSKQSER